MHSANKGKRFERKVAELFSDWSGLKIGRTPMSGAWAKEPGDIVCLEPNAHFPFVVECKHQEGWILDNLLLCNGPFPEWIAQAIEQTEYKVKQTGMLYWPILAFTRNRQPIYLMLPDILLGMEGYRGSGYRPYNFIIYNFPPRRFLVGEANQLLSGISYTRIMENYVKQQSVSQVIPAINS